MTTKKATLYSTEVCPNCKQARQMLEINGYEVDYITIGKDIDVNDFKAQFPEARAVPYILVEGKRLEGLVQLVKFL